MSKKNEQSVTRRTFLGSAAIGAGISAATRVTFDALGGLAENALCDIKEVI